MFNDRCARYVIRSKVTELSQYFSIKNTDQNRAFFFKESGRPGKNQKGDYDYFPETIVIVSVEFAFLSINGS